MTLPDAIVVGLGAMGSSAAYHMARSGLDVVGLDRFDPPHTKGSSHGGSKIIREAYFEDPAYVPLVQRAYDLWRELEHEAGRDLLMETGGLFVGVPDGRLVAGARRAAAEHELVIEELAADELRFRFPVIQPADGMEAVFEPRAGILHPERCVEAQFELARKAGASLRGREQVVSWDAREKGVRVQTRSETFEAEHLVLAAGPWMPELLGTRGKALEVERQVQFLFEPVGENDLVQPAMLPVFAIEPEAGRLLYGFPDLGHGVKLAIHHEGVVTTADGADRSVHPDDERALRELVDEFAPVLNGPVRDSLVCLYTNAPDRHFVLGAHPDHDNVIVLSCCSGHGFKFASAVGQIAAHLVAGKRPDLPLDLFAPARIA
ncbi:MAG TPA: N-methyl-L-tryptophan oxidase [Nitriliruptorales bacterium]